MHMTDREVGFSIGQGSTVAAGLRRSSTLAAPWKVLVRGSFEGGKNLDKVAKAGGIIFE